MVAAFFGQGVEVRRLHSPPEMIDTDALSALRMDPNSDQTPDPHGFQRAARARMPSEHAEFTRLKCRRCGAVVGALDVRTDPTSGSLVHGSDRCGPVLEQTARSHRAFLEWLFEAARR